VALFSDLDWVIVVAAAGFLLFGRGNAEVLRTLGRWYGRAGRLKQELLAEFTKAADLPTPASGGSLTLRGALLGLDPPQTQRSGIPAAVTTPPGPTPSATVRPEPLLWTGAYPTPTWSATAPFVGERSEGSP
jgi:hypothetical protein